MMALMKTIQLFAKEKPVVQREQQRNQYTSLEYLLAKCMAELPLDAMFAGIFTTTLKAVCGIRIGWEALTGVFMLMTVAGASMGFAIGALVRPRNNISIQKRSTVVALLSLV
jgi:ABC-type multidrug transport system permease subunit